MMSYLSIFEVEVDYKLCLLIKQQLSCFLIWKYEFIRCYKLKCISKQNLNKNLFHAKLS